MACVPFIIAASSLATFAIIHSSLAFGMDFDSMAELLNSFAFHFSSEITISKLVVELEPSEQVENSKEIKLSVVVDLVSKVQILRYQTLPTGQLGPTCLPYVEQVQDLIVKDQLHSQNLIRQNLWVLAITDFEIVTASQASIGIIDLPVHSSMELTSQLENQITVAASAITMEFTTDQYLTTILSVEYSIVKLTKISFTLLTITYLQTMEQA